MKYLVSFIFILSAGTVLASDQWGSQISLRESVDLGKAVQESDKNKGKDILITAKVGKVCKKKGCWMTLESNNKKDVRVTFKDYGFFVPFSLVGKQVLVQGQLSEHKMSLKEAKHYAEDAGQDPKTITTAPVEYRFVAAGVKAILPKSN